MIKADQPTCFPADVLAMVSSRDDGTVLDRSIGVHAPEIVTNRKNICESAGIDYDNVAYQRIIYDDSGTYSLIADVDNRSTSKSTFEIVADALFTRSIGVGMILPVADCVATGVYDPINRSLALAHLRRHS
ncbi:MAG: laccase domain-containing protein, partial [Candidatus Saccharimonadaceae bacterium]